MSLFDRLRRFVRGGRPLSGGGGHGGGHHGGGGHHHGGGGGWRGGWGPGYYPDYYGPEVIVVAPQQNAIVVDRPTGSIMTVGSLVQRAGGGWIRLNSATESGGVMIVDVTQRISGNRDMSSKFNLPIVASPPGFPNQRVAFVP